MICSQRNSNRIINNWWWNSGKTQVKLNQHLMWKARNCLSESIHWQLPSDTAGKGLISSHHTWSTLLHVPVTFKEWTSLTCWASFQDATCTFSEGSVKFLPMTTLYLKASRPLWYLCGFETFYSALFRLWGELIYWSISPLWSHQLQVLELTFTKPKRPLGQMFPKCWSILRRSKEGLRRESRQQTTKKHSHATKACERHEVQRHRPLPCRVRERSLQNDEGADEKWWTLCFSVAGSPWKSSSWW